MLHFIFLYHLIKQQQKSWENGTPCTTMSVASAKSCWWLSPSVISDDGADSFMPSTKLYWSPLFNKLHGWALPIIFMEWLPGESALRQPQGSRNASAAADPKSGAWETQGALTDEVSRPHVLTESRCTECYTFEIRKIVEEIWWMYQLVFFKNKSQMSQYLEEVMCVLMYWCRFLGLIVYTSLLKTSSRSVFFVYFFL